MIDTKIKQINVNALLSENASLRNALSSIILMCGGSYSLAYTAAECERIAKQALASLATLDREPAEPVNQELVRLLAEAVECHQQGEFTRNFGARAMAALARAKEAK